MMRILSLLLLFSLALWSHPAAVPQTPWRPAPKRSEAVKTMVVTGGHEHDADFYTVFADEYIRAIVEPYPNAFQSDFRQRADVLVLYDMVRQMTPQQEQHLRTFVESGKGIVILHHGICARVDWQWWYEEVAGGRWLFEPANGMPASTYRHDEQMAIRPVLQHPVTDGIGVFQIQDETYKGLWISPRVKVLLTTDNPHSDGPVAWLSPYDKSRVVYIQLGHDRNASLNPHWQRLVRNAIRWAAGRNQ